MDEHQYWYMRHAEEQQYREVQHAATMDSIKESKQFGYWQLCPKCNGEKKVTVYYPDTTGTISIEPCGICNGAGVLARPIINNENKQE